MNERKVRYRKTDVANWQGANSKIKQFLTSKGIDVKEVVILRGGMVIVNGQGFGVYEPREGIYRFGSLMKGSEVCAVEKHGGQGK